MRKMFNFWRVCVILSASLFSLQSCLDVDDNPKAIQKRWTYFGWIVF